MLSCRPIEDSTIRVAWGRGQRVFHNQMMVTMEPKNEVMKVEYAAWIGLDWGSEKHAIALRAAGSSQIEQNELKQTPETLHHWFLKPRKRFPEGQVALAIEQSKGAIINFLLG